MPSAPTVEELTSHAVAYLSHGLLDVASTCLYAIDPLWDLDVRRPVSAEQREKLDYWLMYDESPAAHLERLRNAQDLLRDAEALTATLLNRSGVSWAAMTGASRQGAHRRLAKRGDELFDESQEYATRDWFLRELESYRSFVETWVGRTPARTLRTTIRSAAKTLVALRKEPTWWRNKFYRRSS